MATIREIDAVIMGIEAEWVEYNNGSKTHKDAQSMQRFLINELIHKETARILSALDKCQTCGKPNKVHQSMYDCHACRTKHY